MLKIIKNAIILLGIFIGCLSFMLILNKIIVKKDYIEQQVSYKSSYNMHKWNTQSVIRCGRDRINFNKIQINNDEFNLIKKYNYYVSYYKTDLYYKVIHFNPFLKNPYMTSFEEVKNNKTLMEDQLLFFYEKQNNIKILGVYFVFTNSNKNEEYPKTFKNISDMKNNKEDFVIYFDNLCN